LFGTTDFVEFLLRDAAMLARSWES